SLVTGSRVQGLPGVEDRVPCRARRHVSDKGDLAFCRRAAARRARAHGRGLLVLRACCQPQGAGKIPPAPPRGGSFLTPGHARGAVPPLDARKLRDLIFCYFSVPRSMAAVVTAE